MVRHPSHPGVSAPLSGHTPPHQDNNKIRSWWDTHHTLGWAPLYQVTHHLTKTTTKLGHGETPITPGGEHFSIRSHNTYLCINGTTKKVYKNCFLQSWEWFIYRSYNNRSNIWAQVSPYLCTYLCTGLLRFFKVWTYNVRNHIKRKLYFLFRYLCTLLLINALL